MAVVHNAGSSVFSEPFLIKLADSFRSSDSIEVAETKTCNEWKVYFKILIKDTSTQIPSSYQCIKIIIQTSNSKLSLYLFLCLFIHVVNNIPYPTYSQVSFYKTTSYLSFYKTFRHISCLFNSFSWDTYIL